MSHRLKLLLRLSIHGLVLCAASLAHGQACSDRTLHGSYGYTVTGNIVTPVGPFIAGPFAAVGRIVFDGEGHVSTTRSLSDNGEIIQNDSGTGTYLVKPDCTGSFNISVGPPGNDVVLSLDIVFDGEGEIRGVVTTSGTALLFDGRRQVSMSR